MRPVDKPELVPFFTGKWIKNIAAGGNRSMVTSKKSHSEYPSLHILDINGIAPFQPEIFRPDSFSHGSRPYEGLGVRDMAMSAHHTIVATSQKIYIFGENTQGQLGKVVPPNHSLDCDNSVTDPVTGRPISIHSAAATNAMAALLNSVINPVTGQPISI
jgi:alpha-tubulin suppressor-like RCC1 family protein